MCCHNDCYNYTYCGYYRDMRPTSPRRQCVKVNLDYSHLFFGGFGGRLPKLLGAEETEGGKKQNANG